MSRLWTRITMKVWQCLSSWLCLLRKITDVGRPSQAGYIIIYNKLYFLLDGRGNILHFLAGTKDDSFSKASTQALGVNTVSKSMGTWGSQTLIQWVLEVHSLSFNGYLRCTASHSKGTWGAQSLIQWVPEVHSLSFNGYLRCTASHSMGTRGAQPSIQWVAEVHSFPFNGYLRCTTSQSMGTWGAQPPIHWVFVTTELPIQCAYKATEPPIQWVYEATQLSIQWASEVHGFSFNLSLGNTTSKSKGPWGPFLAAEVLRFEADSSAPSSTQALNKLS
jgi:hypothetical protein